MRTEINPGNEELLLCGLAGCNLILKRARAEVSGGKNL